MNYPTSASTVYEIKPGRTHRSLTRDHRSGLVLSPTIAANPLERLAELMHSNERLMNDLATSRLRISDAQAYLDAPGANIRFGQAHLERCRIKHTRILAQLRANRIEALQLLGEGGSGV